MNNDFDYTMSYMKAIGIICVVAGHSYTGSVIEGFVGLFHMPLFFFVSGYLFNENKYLSPPQHLTFVKRKISGLYWPTLKWILFAILIHNLLYSIGVYSSEYSYADNVPSYYNSHDMIVSILNAFVLRCNELIFAGIWFLRFLFIASILCLFLIRFTKGKSFAFTISFFLLLFCFITSLGVVRVRCGGTINLIFFSSFFYYTGYLWKKFYSEKYDLIFTSMPVCCIYFVCLLCGLLFWRTGMINISAYKVLPFTVTALMGIFLVMSLSKLLSNIGCVSLKRYMNYLGGHTYDILMMHIIGFKLVTLLIILVCGSSMREIASFPTFHSFTEKGWFLVYIIIGLNLPLVFKLIYVKVKNYVVALFVTNKKRNN